MSEGLVQGLYVAAEMGFEPAPLRMQGTKLTTEPPCPSKSVVETALISFILYFSFVAAFYNIFVSLPCDVLLDFCLSLLSHEEYVFVCVCVSLFVYLVG